jgi:hypothetical protein
MKHKLSWAERCRHPLFRRWTHIRQCLLNPHYPDYKEGLTCDGIDDFEEFADWVEREIGLPPSPQHKMNRIDQSQGWIQGNLRWTDSSGVGHNLGEHNIWVELEGERLCLQDIAQRYNIKYGTVASRYHRGWTAEQIVSTRPKLGNKILPRRRRENTSS